MNEFFTQHLLTLQVGTMTAKLKTIWMMTLFLSPLPYILERVLDWTIENSTYILFVFGAIIIDHILGTIIHLFIKYDFTIKKNLIGLLVKVGLVLAVGFMFEGINAIVRESNILKDYLIICLRLLVFLYPAGSALANSSILTKGKFPPQGILSKINCFQKDLDVKRFYENK